MEAMAITLLSQLDPNGSYTYSDYLKWQFEELVEVIKGKVFPMSAPMSRHQQIVGNLYLIVGNYLRRKTCRVFVAPFDVRLPTYDINGGLIPDTQTIVQPDICVICDTSKIDERGCNGVPDMIIEVLSPSTAKKDLNEKFNLYEEMGVKEYWIVFPEAKTISVYLLENDKYNLFGHFGHLQQPGNVKVHTFPELEVDLEEAFENVV
jgi:Uma2 family endonuclease